MGINFTIARPDVDEESLTDPDPWLTAQRLAKEKALVVFQSHPDSLVIAGDTVVAYQDSGTWHQLTKPVDEEDALRILRILSGREHTVITGVCVKCPKGMSAFTESSQVTFKSMSDDEIRAYIATGEPMDKAGAYGLQGGARPFIQKVEGSINNVIGLPTEKLSEALGELCKGL